MMISQKLTQVAHSCRNLVKVLAVVSGVLFVSGIACLFVKGENAC